MCAAGAKGEDVAAGAPATASDDAKPAVNGGVASGEGAAAPSTSTDMASETS